MPSQLSEKKNLFFIECILQCNTYTTPLTLPIPPRETQTPNISLEQELPIAGLLSKGCRSLPPTDLSLKHLVLHEMEIANSNATDKH